MRVSVFGLGYVGCVSAACFARMGHDVIGVDLNADKVAMVNAASSPVVERGLTELMREVVAARRLRATTSSADAVRASDVGLICVGTPSVGGGRLDVSSLRRVAADIGQSLRDAPKPFTVAVRSTTLPGVAEHIVLPALQAVAGGRASAGVALGVNPEFIREGSALADFWAPAFTLVGCRERSTAAILRSLYEGVEAPFIQTEIRTAEMVKYAANAFHALKVCFANELGDVAAALGADPQEVARIFTMDHKLTVSDAYLKPGFAFGGSCLPKDVRALLHAARERDVSLPLLSAILPSNEHQLQEGISAVLETRKRRIGMVGLAFKPGTDDLRESPLVRVVEALIGKGCDVRVLDASVSIARVVGANRRYIEEEIPHIASLMCEDPEALLRHAEVIVIGSATAEAARVIAGATSEHMIVDLTRRWASRREMRPVAA